MHYVYVCVGVSMLPPFQAVLPPTAHEMWQKNGKSWVAGISNDNDTAVGGELLWWQLYPLEASFLYVSIPRIQTAYIHIYGHVYMRDV